MDERRALIAVVLIFLVLFGYNYFMGKTAPAPVPGPATEPVAEAGAGGSGAVEPEGAVEDVGRAGVPAGEEPGAVTGEGVTAEDAVGEAARETVPERRILVDSPRWTATLSTKGGSIVSWRLKEYAAAGGTPVDLVPADTKALPVEIRYGPTTLSTDAWDFSYEGPERIVLEDGGAPVAVRFEALRDGIRVTKEYSFGEDGYAFDVAVLAGGLVEPGARRELWIGWPGVAPTEQKEDERALSSVSLVDGKAKRANLGSLKKGDRRRESGTIGWVTSQSQYFVAAVVPEGSSFSAAEAFGDAEARTVGFTAGLPFEGDSLTARFRVFVGPQDYHALRGTGEHLEWAIDLGWSIFRPIAAFTLIVLVWAHRFIPNYGVVIIVISILTKLLFYRLTHKSFTEMKRMQDLQPKLEELKKKHANDREALAREQMELYKRERVNPLGSCLPMVLQMPVFIALYQVLRTTIELRGAPFALWITDLSMPDTVASIAGFPIHILPLLMGIAMLAQQRMSSKDPSQALVGNLMPIVFTALFYNFASGLTIYWLVNTVLSVVQQFYVQRGMAAPVTGNAAAPDGGPGYPLPSATDRSVIDAEVVSGPGPRQRAGGSRTGMRRRGRK